MSSFDAQHIHVADDDSFPGYAPYSDEDAHRPDMYGFDDDPNSESPLGSVHVNNGNGAASSRDYSDGAVLPPPSELEPEEGFVLREWRRQNAIQLGEKEKREKELRNQTVEEAEEYKRAFEEKRKVTAESNKVTNREREKLYLENEEKFHKNANKEYWKTIADLIPREVPNIEKRGKKDNKPSVTVIQGPKPGKPTDLSRMRQILLKLKHVPPPHMIPPPPAPAPAPTKDAKNGQDGEDVPKKGNDGKNGKNGKRRKAAKNGKAGKDAIAENVPAQAPPAQD